MQCSLLITYFNMQGLVCLSFPYSSTISLNVASRQRFWDRLLIIVLPRNRYNIIVIILVMGFEAFTGVATKVEFLIVLVYCYMLPF
jgi:hypothetical protein